jgi:hypothetical protein
MPGYGDSRAAGFGNIRCFPAFEPERHEHDKAAQGAGGWSAPVRYSNCMRHRCLPDNHRHRGRHQIQRCPSINEVESHGEHASSATTSRHQGLKAGFPWYFDVIAVAAAIADSRDSTGGELLEEPFAPHYVASPSKKFRPVLSCCGVVHLYSPKRPIASGGQSPFTENVSLRLLG